MKIAKYLCGILISLPILTGLHGCHSDNDVKTQNAPRQLMIINNDVFQQLRANPDIAPLFAGADLVSGSTELCDVKVMRMSYNTVGGAGEDTNSGGVVMLPQGDNANCAGPNPVVLYAHGTTAEKDYDLSAIASDLLNTGNPNHETNPATSEAMLLLSVYASRGFAVIAPNYAGYADSSLDYHPYLDEQQQTTEMINALDHVRTYASIIDARLSDQLFVSGVSAGGYVAMAAHKALQAEGETVTASLPISGPYAMLDFVDSIMAGYVNLGATTFAPLYLTSLEKAHDIYQSPSEIYAAPYDMNPLAEGALPAADPDATGLPEFAIFSLNGPVPADAQPFNTLGFSATDYLLADAFRTAYLTDAASNAGNPAYAIRALVHDADLRDWVPSSPMLMCGAGSDPVVYHRNSDLMEQYLRNTAPALISQGAVINLDLDDTPAGPFANIMQLWMAAGITGASVHGSTGIYCSMAGLGYFSNFITN